MADQNPSDAPSLPPIPMIPFQGPPPDQPAPNTPTEMAAASLSSSVDNDMPISEVVAALKNAPQTGAPSAPAATTAPILTEVKTEIPAATTTTVTTAPVPAATVAAPSVTTTVSVTPPPAIPKGPLYEDPDLVKVPGTQ